MSVVKEDGAEATIELASWPAPVDEGGKRREDWANIHPERYFFTEEKKGKLYTIMEEGNPVPEDTEKLPKFN